jgi:hypothetical protein
MPDVNTEISFGIDGRVYMKSFISYFPAGLGFLKTI